LYPYSFRFTTIDPYNFRRPYVIDHSPNGTNASLSTNISITFNEPIYTPSLEDSIQISPYIDAEISLVDDRKIIINPVENLSYITEYYVSINTQIVNMINRSMKFPFNFSFTTESDTIPPYVIDHYPTGNVELHPDLKTISIIFSEPVDRITVQDRFKVSPNIIGNYSWLNDDRSMNYEISQLLLYNSSYIVTIEPGYLDKWDNPSIEEFNFSFVTVVDNGTPSNGKPNETDKSPPFIIDYFPSIKDMVPVEIDWLIITFNEQVNQTSVEDRFKIKPTTKGKIFWTNNNMTLNYLFSENLLYSTNYTIQLLPGFSDLAGNQNLEPFEFWFRTIKGFSQFNIIDYSPNGGNVSIDSNINITFNRVPDFDSVVNAFNIEPRINGTFSLKYTTITFDPDSELDYNTTYSVTLENTANDKNHISLNRTLNWYFTTQRLINNTNDTNPEQNNNTGNDTDDSQSENDALDYLLVFGIVIIIVVIVIIFLIFLFSRKNRKKDITTTDDEENKITKKEKQIPKQKD
jgi:hypothetical protein